MTTSHLPSKLVRSTGLLVASALLAFSTSAATAATTPETTDLTTALAATGSATLATATEPQLAAALLWTGTATAKAGNKTPLTAATAVAYAKAIQANNTNYPTATSNILSDIITGAKGASKKDVPVTTVAAVANVFLSGTPALTDAAAMAVVTQGLSSPIFTSGVTKAVPAETLMADYIKGIWSTATVASWDGGAKGSADALAQITATVLAADTTSTASKAKVAADVFAYSSKNIAPLVQYLTKNPASLGTDAGTFALALEAIVPTDIAPILTGVANGNPSLVLSGNLVEQAIAAEPAADKVKEALAVTGSLASITASFDSADGIANSVATGLGSKLTVPTATTIAETLAKSVISGSDVNLSGATVTGTALDTQRAEEVAAEIYTLAKATPNFTAANFEAMVVGILGSAKYTTSNGSVSSFYTYLAGDLALTAQSLAFTKALTAAQFTAMVNEFTVVLKKVDGSAEQADVATIKGLLTVTPASGVLAPYTSGANDPSTSMVLE